MATTIPMDRIAQYKLATFHQPTNIRHIAHEEQWSHDELLYLNESKSLQNTIYAADFLHLTMKIQQCTCWRLAKLCTLFTQPSFNVIICPSCMHEHAEMDQIKRKERIYFDQCCRPIGRITVGYDDSTALQPSVNISSCCSFVAAMIL